MAGKLLCGILFHDGRPLTVIEFVVFLHDLAPIRQDFLAKVRDQGHATDSFSVSAQDLYAAHSIGMSCDSPFGPY